MFQFTTTNVINSNEDSTGKELWTSAAANEETGKPASFHVKRVNNFLAPNVKAIYKAVANDPEMAKVTISLSGIKAKDAVTKTLRAAQDGDQFRLAIYVGLTQASQDSRYSNDMVLKGKPFTVDFVWDTDAKTTVENLVKTIEKYQLLVYTERLLNVEYNEEYLTIEATTEYQRFKKVNIEAFDSEAHFGMGEYIVVKSLDNLREIDNSETLSGELEGYFVGKEGFGTYSWILHNLRLPTSARTSAFSINKEETPVPGALYDQYTIHYCANRGILGLNAVGEVTKSLTTHVFFVRQDLAESFETALKTVAPEEGIVEVPEKKD